MKKLIFLVFLLAVVAAGVIAGSPYYVAYQLNQAYEARDGDAVVRHIDFDRVRPSVKHQLNTRFAKTMDGYPAIKELGGAPLAAFAGQFINTSVDKAVTADNVATLIRTDGQVDDATKQLAAAWAIASNQVDLQNLVQALIINRGDVQAVAQEQVQQMMAKQAEVAQSSDPKPTLAYCGYDCFTLSSDIRGYAVSARMERQGWIDWQIVDVTLP